MRPPRRGVGPGVEAVTSGGRRPRRVLRQSCNTELHSRTMPPCRASGPPSRGVRRPPRAAGRARRRSSRRPGRLFDERGVAEAQIEDIARAVGHQPGDRLPALHRQGGAVRPRAGRLPRRARAPRSPTPRRRARQPREPARGAGLGVRRLRRRPPGVRRLRAQPDAAHRAPSSSTRSPRARCCGSVARSRRAWPRCAGRSRPASTAGDFTVEDPVLLANTLYATGLGGLQLARVGLVIDEASPGVPHVGRIGAEQVKALLLTSALAMAGG